jgi:hypothetical protein
MNNDMKELSSTHGWNTKCLRYMLPENNNSNYLGALVPQRTSYKDCTKTEIKTSFTQTVFRAPDTKLKLPTLNINN